MTMSSIDYRHPGLSLTEPKRDTTTEEWRAAFRRALWARVQHDVRMDQGAARSDTRDQRGGVRVQRVRYPYPNTLGL